MPTDAILDALYRLDEAPWGDLVGGRPLNPRGLAKRLGPYGVKSKNIRVRALVVKGYTRDDLADAWSRYLSPPPSPQESATSATPSPEEPEDGAVEPRTERHVGRSATQSATRSAEEENPAATQDFGSDDEELERDVADVADSWEEEGSSHADATSVADGDSAGTATGAPAARTCVECGVALPAGWNAIYCDRHGGRVDAADDPRADPKVPRLDPVRAEPPNQPPGIGGSPSPASPRGCIGPPRHLRDCFGGQCVAFGTHGPQLGQEANAEARRAFLGSRDKRSGRSTGTLWPIVAGAAVLPSPLAKTSGSAIGKQPDSFASETPPVGTTRSLSLRKMASMSRSLANWRHPSSPGS